MTSLAQRTCEVCGSPANGPTSAHFARVVWLCAGCSDEFHAPATFSAFRSAPCTVECWRRIDAWIAIQQGIRRALQLMEHISR